MRRSGLRYAVVVDESFRPYIEAHRRAAEAEAQMLRALPAVSAELGADVDRFGAFLETAAE